MVILVSYGELVIEPHKSLELRVHEKILRFENIDSQSIRYSRIYLDKVEFETLILGKYVALYPCTITNKIGHNESYLYLRLIEPISFAPGLSMRLYIKCPVDVGVYAVKDSTYGLVDIIESSVKYAVYGAIDSGILARYFKVVPQRELPLAGLGSMVYVLDIENNSDSWIKFSRVIIPLASMRVYLWKNIAISEVVCVILRSQRTADVVLANRSPYVDAYELPVLPKQALKYTTYSMKWGV